MLTIENSAEDVGTGLKTAPFQCQGKREGLMRGLEKELMAGGARGERRGG